MFVPEMKAVRCRSGTLHVPFANILAPVATSTNPDRKIEVAPPKILMRQSKDSNSISRHPLVRATSCRNGRCGFDLFQPRTKTNYVSNSASIPFADAVSKSRVCRDELLLICMPYLRSRSDIQDLRYSCSPCRRQLCESSSTSALRSMTGLKPAMASASDDRFLQVDELLVDVTSIQPGLEKCLNSDQEVHNSAYI